MTVNDFIKNNKVIHIVDDLKQHFSGSEKFIISDIIDAKGRQYIDIVQEGGGVLGIALLGYTYVLEQMGVRFLNIGGTSAGAINSLLLAAADKPENPKTEKILEILADKNLSDFLDGDDDAQDFIKSLLDTFTPEENKEKGLLDFFIPKDTIDDARLLIDGLQVIDNFKSDLGLNPGESFHQWLKDVLFNFGVNDTSDLQDKMKDYPEFIIRKNRKDLIEASKKTSKSNYSRFEINSRLAIIAAELNTETKIEFPLMRELFYKNVDMAHPADFVRASMSIPLFFKPFVIGDVPQDEDSIRKWRRIANHQGGAPERAVFVDGGIMSNFPIDAFHRNGLPSRPTFGVKLGLERQNNKSVTKVSSLVLGCFNAARNLRDFEFIYKNPDYINLVAFIDTEDIDWINFDISDENKLELFVRGAEAAKDFLLDFDWEDYKNTRRVLKTSIYRTKVINSVIEHAGEAYKQKTQLELPESSKALIRERIIDLRKQLHTHVLWIDDRCEALTSEIKCLEALGMTVTVATSSDLAKQILETTETEVDLIISDTKRQGESEAGSDFAEWICNTYPEYSKKIIFYITRYKPGQGAPPFSFGITDSPEELLHLVLDFHSRLY